MAEQPPTDMNERRPSTDVKTALGWRAILSGELMHKQRSVHDEIAPSSDEGALPNPQAELGGAAPSTIPSDAIFNTQFTTAGRKFLSKVKKNRAMQVDRRTKGFQQGLDSKTVVLDPITKKHYRVMIVDSDLQHREDLADALEQHFEIFVAATNERAFALLAMFKVDFILLRLALGNDRSATTSTGLEFLREIKKRYFHIPVSLLVRDSNEQDKLIAQALASGGCGYFQDDIEVNVLIRRLTKLLHSLVLASVELVKCCGKGLSTKYDDDDLAQGSRATQALIKRGTITNLSKRPATSKPASIVYDKEKMLMELSLKQRKQCLERRKQLTKTLAISHSVLGIGLDDEHSSDLDGVSTTPLSALRSPSLMHCESAPLTLSPSSPALAALRTNSIMKKIPPLPSQKEISKQIYAKPHEIQVKIHRHLYESYHTNRHEAVPHDPLLRPCIAIDPETVSRSATNLLVGKAYRLFLEKRYEEARQQCDRAIRLQDNNVVKLAYLLRGVLYDISGNHVRAEREFLTCVSLDNSMHQAHFNLCVCRLKMGKDQQALHDATTAIHLYPSNEHYLANRALIYRRLGEFGLAQIDYCKLESLRHTPKDKLPGLVSGSPPSPAPKAAVAATDVDDGLFDHLFGKPTSDKLALVYAPQERDTSMLDLVVARLQNVVFFQDFPREVLLKVANHLEYEVISCGKSFVLGEDHPANFYVLISGRISVRRNLGDFASSVTTHHIDAGMPFGCTGHIVTSHSKLIADESCEIGILWPDAYDSTIRSFCTEKNNEIFTFLQLHKAFKLFSTSELGHIIGISERRRYRKGEILLEQNEIPKYLMILRKGTCLMYQDFNEPPLCNSDSEFRHRAGSADHNAKEHVLPFHRLLATPDWPLGFRVQHQHQKKRKHVRGARRNALIDRRSTPKPADLMLQAAHNQLEDNGDENDVDWKSAQLDSEQPVRVLSPGSIFGESVLLEQQHWQAKCSVIADSIADVLLFDHLRLQEMELAPEVVDEIMKNAPEYVNEDQAIKKQAASEAWNEYKNLRMLELSKTRWPEAKKHLRVLSNGYSIMLDTDEHRSKPSSVSATRNSSNNRGAN